MTALRFSVVGVPAPQGSVRGFNNAHTGRVVIVQDSKKTKPWRQDVKAAAVQARTDTSHEQFDGPVDVAVTFRFPRPGYHFRSGKFAHLLRDGCPSYVDKKPDLDKCLRAFLDALTEAGVWRDDAQVASVAMTKVYCSGGELPGADVMIIGINAVAESRDVEDVPIQDALL